MCYRAARRHRARAACFAIARRRAGLSALARATPPSVALAARRVDVYLRAGAASAPVARAVYAAFERKWTPRCPGVVRNLQEGGEELFTFFQFPKSQ